MHPILIIARYTLQDFWHRHSIALAVSITVGSYLFGYFLTSLTVGGHTKIMIDVSFLSYQLFLISFLLLLGLPFIDRQNNYSSLFIAKPFSRSIIIYGFSLGFFIAMILSGFYFYSITLLILYHETQHWFFYLFPAFCTMTLEGIILTQAALFFSLLLAGPCAYCALFAYYLIGYYNDYWYSAHKTVKNLWSSLSTLAYYVIPNLSLLDIKSMVMYKVPYSNYQIGITIFYLVLLTGLFLFSNQLIFSRKQFK